jgi:hypothetical protein
VTIDAYYWTPEHCEDVVEAARATGVKTTMWFGPGGPHGDPAKWWLRPEFVEEHLPRRVIESERILVPELFEAADRRIRLAGHRGPTSEWDGLLGPNYEQYSYMTRPPSLGTPWTPQKSYENHALLYHLLKRRYPWAQIYCWGLGGCPAKLNWRGLPHDYHLPGLLMLGRLQQLYDVACPSCYLKGDDEAANREKVRRNMDNAQSTGKPIIACMNPWTRNRSTDGLWHPASVQSLEMVLDEILTYPNVVAIEMWSMVKHGDIEAGRMGPEIANTWQIDAHIAGAVGLLGQFLQTEGLAA